MGWEIIKKSSALKYQYLKILYILILIISGILVRNFEFKSIDYFLRDSLQKFNSIGHNKLNTDIVNINFDPARNTSNSKINYKELTETINKILKSSPRIVILSLEPFDLIDDERELIEIRKYLEANNIYITQHIKSFAGTSSFDQHSKFKNFKFFFPYTEIRDGSKHLTTRRISLKYINGGPDELLLGLQKIKYPFYDESYFEHSFEYWNTIQIYTKSLNVGTFGNYSASDIKNYDDRLKNKLIVLGKFDEFTFLTGANVTQIFEEKKPRENLSYAIPFSHVLASQLNVLTTGDYIKFIDGFYLHFFSIIFLIYILLVVKSLKLKAMILTLTLPMVIFLMIIIYLLFGLYSNIANTIVYIFIVQYLTLPSIYFKYITLIKIESANKLLSVEKNALKMLSREVAHDLRTPLSTLKLLSIKANFDNTEMKLLFTDAIDKIDKIVDELLTENNENSILKIKNQISEIEFNEIISKIFKDFQHKEPKISFKINYNNKIGFGISIDKLKLHRILSNIIQNSIDSLEKVKSPQIIINSHIKDDCLIISIIDNGSGISEADLPNIGKWGNTTKGPYGNGIGLASAIEVLKKNDGELKIESRKGVGTEVTLRLRLVGLGKVVAKGVSNGN